MSEIETTSLARHLEIAPVYLKEIGRRTWLTRARENELFDKIAAGRRRALLAIAQSPDAIAEVLLLGARLRRGLVRHTELSQTFGRDGGIRRGARTREMLLQFERVAKAAPRDAFVRLDALCLCSRQLSRIVDRLEERCTDSDPAFVREVIYEMRLGLRSVHKARNELLESCLRQVVTIARRYRHTGVELMDLIQEGNVGLMIAAEKFDPELGFRFSTYAHWWIFQGISRAIMRKSRLVRCPSQLQEGVGRLNRVLCLLRQRQGQEPGDHEVAAEMDLPVDAVRELRTVSSLSVVSIDSPPGDDDHHCTSHAVHDEAQSPHSIYLSRAMESRIHGMLSALTAREQAIVCRRFGLNSHREHTLAELGREFSLTRERIRQILQAALVRLRKRDANNALLEYACP